MNKLFCNWSKFALSLLFVVILIWGWIAFKKAETILFPVVSGFEIHATHKTNGSLYISGVMKKERECTFKYLSIYDRAVNPIRLLEIEFLDTPKHSTTREAGFQAWGEWKITPQSKNILVTVTHKCSTGTVKTRLFDGVI